MANHKISRIDIIGQNGNDGEHYEEIVTSNHDVTIKPNDSGVRSDTPVTGSGVRHEGDIPPSDE